MLRKIFVKVYFFLAWEFIKGRTVYFLTQNSNIEKEKHCKNLQNVYVGSVYLFSLRSVILEKLVWKAQPERLDMRVQSEKTDRLLPFCHEKNTYKPLILHLRVGRYR